MMPWYIDANTKVRRVLVYYDEQSETWRIEEVPVANTFKAYSNEGCPAPANVQEVKHGKWKDTTAYCGEFTCSICKDTCITNRYAYCPHCGAKMDGKVNE